MWNCRIKGKFRIDEDITSTNPIAVGDWVTLEVEDPDNHIAKIDNILERKNYIVRSSPHRKAQKHILAANMDQALLVATIKEPRTSQGFIDRFLVTAAAYHIPAMLVFNKADLYRKKEMDRYERMAGLYADIGYHTLLISVAAQTGMEGLQALLKDRITLLCGHSGVGKSSLINWLIPGRALKVQEVSGWSGKGLHTTTFAEMMELPFGGKVIDTPGIRELGIVDLEKAEISHYFPEMRRYLADCQFNNCLHLNEPGCAIKAALEEGEIDVERYVSYVNILESLPDNAY